MNQYTLEDLFNFDNNQLESILAHFGYIPSDDFYINRYNAIMISHRYGILNKDDIEYVLDPNFYDLVVNDGLQLEDVILEIEKLPNNFDDAARIMSVTQIPKTIPNDLAAYKIGNFIYLCGNKTLQIRDKLRLLGGRYISGMNCWKFDPVNQVEIQTLILDALKYPVDSQPFYIDRSINPIIM